MQDYTLTELGSYKHYSDDPHIHDGMVIGGQDRPSNTRHHVHAAIWDGSWTLLPDPASGCDWSIGLGGNRERVVGFVVPQGERTNTRAALWESDAAWALTLLPLPANTIASAAMATSLNGEVIVGEVLDIENRNRAARWSLVNGTWNITVLPQPGSRGSAYGIGEADIYGNLVDGSVSHAVRWRLAVDVWTYITLQLPPGDPSQITTSVNRYSDGLAVGSVTFAEDPSQAAYWDASDQLHLMAAGEHTTAQGHYGGLFVGIDWSTGVPRGFAWSETMGRQEIHPAGWNWSFASSIDAQGRITGVMGMGLPNDESQERRLYLLTPAN